MKVDPKRRLPVRPNCFRWLTQRLAVAAVLAAPTPLRSATGGENAADVLAWADRAQGYTEAGDLGAGMRALRAAMSIALESRVSQLRELAKIRIADHDANVKDPRFASEMADLVLDEFQVSSTVTIASGGVISVAIVRLSVDDEATAERSLRALPSSSISSVAGNTAFQTDDGGGHGTLTIPIGAAHGEGARLVIKFDARAGIEAARRVAGSFNVRAIRNALSPRPYVRGEMAGLFHHAIGDVSKLTRSAVESGRWDDVVYGIRRAYFDVGRLRAQAIADSVAKEVGPDARGLLVAWDGFPLDDAFTVRFDVESQMATIKVRASNSRPKPAELGLLIGVELATGDEAHAEKRSVMETTWIRSVYRGNHSMFSTGGSADGWWVHACLVSPAEPEAQWGCVARLRVPRIREVLFR